MYGRKQKKVEEKEESRKMYQKKKKEESRKDLREMERARFLEEKEAPNLSSNDLELVYMV